MNRLEEILIGNRETTREIGQLLQKGLIRKIAPRLYTSNLTDEPAKIVRRNWFRILAALFPDAMLSHRSAIEQRPTPEGHVFLTRENRGMVQLPGLTVHFLPGPKPTEDDRIFFGSLRISGQARAFLENCQTTHQTGSIPKTIGREGLENKMESLIRVKGEEGLNEIRDQAKLIAPALGMEKEATKLSQLITDMLGTGLSQNLISQRAIARAEGLPFDPDRDELFGSFCMQLTAQEFPEFPEQNRSEETYNHFAFFESYFSNYIEGTEFELDEAKQIIATEMPLPARDEDSHDILGTYQIVSNRAEMTITPTSTEHLFDLLQERHAILLRARTDKNPGVFKDKNNRAGSTEFVDKELVRGTLRKGLDWYNTLVHPFAKAAFMMFLISEVHPFLDGNGRIARVMMNAELSAKNCSKILIPNVYREDYMGTLKKLTKQRDGDAYIRMLLKAWEFSSKITQPSLDKMQKYLTSHNAFLEPREGYLVLEQEVSLLPKNRMREGRGHRL